MICNRCGQGFECGAKAPACWCQSLPIVSGLPTQYKDCLCPACLQHFAKGPEAWRNGDLIEGEDFYYDKNLWVFTEKYHRDKGACCGNGCLHCPY